MIIDFILIGLTSINILVIALAIFKRKYNLAIVLGAIQTIVWGARLGGLF